MKQRGANAKRAARRAGRALRGPATLRIRRIGAGGTLSAAQSPSPRPGGGGGPDDDVDETDAERAARLEALLRVAEAVIDELCVRLLGYWCVSVDDMPPPRRSRDRVEPIKTEQLAAQPLR